MSTTTQKKTSPPLAKSTKGNARQRPLTVPSACTLRATKLVMYFKSAR